MGCVVGVGGGGKGLVQFILNAKMKVLAKCHSALLVLVVLVRPGACCQQQPCPLLPCPHTLAAPSSVTSSGSEAPLRRLPVVGSVTAWGEGAAALHLAAPSLVEWCAAGAEAMLAC